MRASGGRAVVLAALAMHAGCWASSDPSTAIDAGTADAAAADARPPIDRDRGSVYGRVWVPGQAPGQTPVGHEIPVAGAVVYLTRDRPPAIPQRVYCQRCIETPADAVQSRPDGSFEVTTATAGSSWLVIEKGQFRRELRVTITLGQALELPSLDTVLPSRSDPAGGAWMPRVAVAIGTFDPIEDILGKLGMGSLDDRGAMTATDGEIDLYANQSTRDLPTVGTLTGLLSQIDLMRRYHIIFLPCSSADALADPAILRNIRSYVNEGGKLYVTDWSGAIVDRAFPPQIVLGGESKDGAADSTGSYDPVSLDGSLDQVGLSRTAYYDSPDGEVVEPALGGWLARQVGPRADGDPVAFDPDRFAVSHNYNWIASLGRQRLGVDDAGTEIFDEPRTWVVGSNPVLADGVQRPLTVTYQPTGCGRVMYSTYHTAGRAHHGLYLQERILLYLLLEIGVCSTLPPVD